MICRIFFTGAGRGEFVWVLGSKHFTTGTFFKSGKLYDLQRHLKMFICGGWVGYMAVPYMVAILLGL